MAFARIHETALTSPKIVKMFNPRDPFHLWVWGLSYCQMHLTDGAIPREALPHLGAKAAEVLISKRLWETTDDGFQVHDYFQWNDSREVVTKKRAAARDRMTAARDRSREQHQRTNAEQQPRTSADVLRGVASSSGSSRSFSEEIQGKPNLRSAGVFAGALPRDHQHHAFCDDTFSRCVPNAVHDKFSNLLSPKHNGDRDAAKAELQAWYPTVWALLASDFVMGDAFKFWTARFDARFASVDALPAKNSLPSNEEMTRNLSARLGIPVAKS